jgi:membrane protease YdiL (CAAX protease family)
MYNEVAGAYKSFLVGISQFSIADWVLIGIALASLATWIWLWRTRVSVGLPLLQARTRKRPFWTMAEFFVCFGLPILCSFAGISVGKRWMTAAAREQMESGSFNTANQSAQDATVLMIVTAVAMAVTVLSVLVWMNLLSRKHLSDYGFWPSLDDIKLGGITAFLVLPQLILLSTFINILVKYEHPVLDTLDAQMSWQLLLLQAGLTVLLAPLYEEFTFRALLQGGAEQVARKVALADNVESKTEDQQTIAAAEVATWPWWPVLMSSTVFATLHLPHGGGAIPIFFLAIALGYLYRQTGRMGPGLVVHIILNGFSMTVAIINLWLEK